MPAGTVRPPAAGGGGRGRRSLSGEGARAVGNERGEVTKRGPPAAECWGRSSSRRRSDGRGQAVSCAPAPGQGGQLCPSSGSGRSGRDADDDGFRTPVAAAAGASVPVLIYKPAGRRSGRTDARRQVVVEMLFLLALLLPMTRYSLSET